MTITLEPVDPLASETGVSTSTGIDLNINDDTDNLILASTNVYVTRGDGSEEDVYLGGSGYQSPWSGDAPTGDGTGQIQFRNVTRVGGYFEDNDITVRVESANNNSGTLDDSYDFEVETVGFVGNSGFEAPGATSADAKGWTTYGAVREKNPADWASPPEGDHVLTMFSGSVPAHSEYRSAGRLTADLTDAVFIGFVDRSDWPTIAAGDTLDKYVLLDGAVIWSKQLTNADAPVDETEIRQVVLTPTTGSKEIKALEVYTKSGEQVFVPDLADVIPFSGGDGTDDTEDWSGIAQFFDVDTATVVQFSGSDDVDDTDDWFGVAQFFDVGTATVIQFSDGDDYDDTEDWAA